MLLHVLRAIFVLLAISVAMIYISGGTDQLPESDLLGYHREVVLLIALGLALIVVGVDLLIPRKSLMAISGLFFGLVVGLAVTYGLCLIMNLLTESLAPGLRQPVLAEAVTRNVNPDGMVKEVLSRQVVGYRDSPLISAIKLLLGVTSCYLAVSFILQTKDDVRFVIPYVEFSRQTKGTKPLILDTSVIIDGRIADICETRIVEAPLIVPRLVLQELQAIADSSDRLKRNRGRRGLDMLKRLQGSDKVEVQMFDGPIREEGPDETVDQKLVSLANQLDGRVVTNDYNLNKIAQLRGVKVININDLANAIKPVVLPGETLGVQIIKPGEEAGQGVGYLDDGTMVVVEQARDKINTTITIVVTSVLQTSAGRMIFGQLEGAAALDRMRRRGRNAP
jgi:uncharacterized protein YacL